MPFSSRDKGDQTPLEERDDSIVFGDKILHKPFVEKPVSCARRSCESNIPCQINAENHEIYVFFSSADGGGAQYLFRKEMVCIVFALAVQARLQIANNNFQESCVCKLPVTTRTKLLFGSQSFLDGSAEYVWLS